MLSGIDPILTGSLLTYLDAMGHSDAVVVADAHFPADGATLSVQHELIRAAKTTEKSVRFLDRHEFYDVAEGAFLIVRTGETRTYGNALLRKGVVVAEIS